MRRLRWMVVAIGMIGAGLGLSGTLEAAPMPSSAAIAGGENGLVSQVRGRHFGFRHFGHRRAARRHYGYRSAGRRRAFFAPRYRRPMFGYATRHRGGYAPRGMGRALGSAGRRRR